MNNKTIPIAIIIAGVLIGGIILYTNYSNSSDQGEVLSAEQATERVMNFINDVVLEEGMTASLTETLEESGLYKVKFNVDGQDVEWRITKDGNLIFPQTINLADFQEETEEEVTVGNFIVSQDEACLEDGKPIVYFFGSETCPHCQWEHPIIEDVANKFGDNISFHNNMDTGADQDVFMKYSAEGYVPAIVIGCRYYRVGSGETVGEEQERKDLTALTCKLTGNQPAEVCSQVQELINEVK